MIQVIGMVLVPVLIGVIGQILLKKGMLIVGQFDFSALDQLLPQFIKAFLNPYVFMGFVFYFLSSLFWMVVLSKVQLSVAYPLLSLGYVFVLIASWFLFKEPITMIRWLGVLVIICGVTLVSRS